MSLHALIFFFDICPWAVNLVSSPHFFLLWWLRSILISIQCTFSMVTCVLVIHFHILNRPKNVFFFLLLLPLLGNGFLFHIIINEFICNVVVAALCVREVHHFTNVHPHPLILCFISHLANPLDQCRAWRRTSGRGVNQTTIWDRSAVGGVEKKLKFYENRQNQPSSKIQTMFG